MDDDDDEDGDDENDNDGTMMMAMVMSDIMMVKMMAMMVLVRPDITVSGWKDGMSLITRILLPCGRFISIENQ